MPSMPASDVTADETADASSSDTSSDSGGDVSRAEPPFQACGTLMYPCIDRGERAIGSLLVQSDCQCDTPSFATSHELS